jgi:hypothetical protein
LNEWPGLTSTIPGGPGRSKAFSDIQTLWVMIFFVESMTESQLEITSLGWELRLCEERRRNGEIWFAVWPERLPEAHDLAERGWLLRRSEPDLEWRLSDTGLSALRLSAYSDGVSLN